MSPMLAFAIDTADPDDSIGSREYSAVDGSDIGGRMAGASPCLCRDASS